MITTSMKITTNIIGVDLINKFPKDTRNLDANKIRATIIADTNPLLDIEKASPKNIMGTEKYMNILDMETHISNAPVTGTPLFNLIAITTIPKNTNIPEIISDLNPIAQKLGVDIIVNKSELTVETT